MSTSDPYRENIQAALNRSKIYQQLTIKCTDGSDNGGKDLLSLVDKAVEYCSDRSKMILMHMGEFTLHDGEHLFRVLRLMGELIPDDTLTELSNPELALLILTAFFHDIGMAPSDSEILPWLGIWAGDTPSPTELEENQKYSRFREGRSIQLEEIDYLRSLGLHNQAELVEKYLISEYIRITHAERAANIISADWSGMICYKDIDLTSELAQLCKSHNEDGVKLLELEHSIVAGNSTFICLPFIGVILRLADVLDFDGNRTPKVLFAHLGVKDPVSLVEWQKHRSVDAWTIGSKNITFNATCKHPAIEHAIRKFCDQIDYELISCASILSNLHDSSRKPFPSYYQIPLPTNVDRSKIKAKKDIKGEPMYLYRDTKFTLNKEQIIDLLMGTKLYGQPNVALRELIQNSIDACKLRAKMEESWGNMLYTPKVEIKLTKSGTVTTLEVADNGVGMDQHIIDKFYSKVGSSYYKSQDFLELKSSLKSTFIPTSRFGIGILSSFMISDGIEVETKRIYEAHTSSEPFVISISGQDTIFYVKKGNRKEPGTTTRLILRKNNPWANRSDSQVIDFIKQTVPFPPFELSLQANTITETHNVQEAKKIKFDLEYSGWYPHDNLRQVRIDFDGTQGISGACVVALLEKDGIPVTRVETISEPVNIEGTKFTFKSETLVEDNRYATKNENIDPKTIGKEIKTEIVHSFIAESKSKLALHGVEIPMSLFSHFMGNTYSYAKVHWPLSVMMNINISGVLDINLNSARTEILMDEKWTNFEGILVKLICQGIQSKVGVDYWNKWKELISKYDKRTYSSTFLTSLSEV